jgi:hypothetical protein
MNRNVIFGIPEEWNQFENRHSLFIERLSNLTEAFRIAFDWTADTSSPLDRAIYFSGRLCVEEFSEVLLLCGNGYGVAALRLIRGMYERTVTARYLHSNPIEVDDFYDFHWVSQHRLMKALQETFGPEILDKKTSAEVEERFQLLKDRFSITSCKKCKTKRLNHTWSKIDFVSMAKRAGPVGELIVPGYYLPTNQAHSTVGAILSRIDPESKGFIFDGGPQHKRADDALITAHNLALNNLDLQKDHFNLASLEDPLQKCLSDFRDIWKRS